MIPLYKSDVFLFNNYRPITLLCVISKVFEKVMYNRLINFIEKFAIWMYKNAFKHGFNDSYEYIDIFPRE